MQWCLLVVLVMSLYVTSVIVRSRFWEARSRPCGSVTGVVYQACERGLQSPSTTTRTAGGARIHGPASRH